MSTGDRVVYYGWLVWLLGVLMFFALVFGSVTYRALGAHPTQGRARPVLAAISYSPRNSLNQLGHAAMLPRLGGAAAHQGRL